MTLDLKRPETSETENKPICEFAVYLRQGMVFMNVDEISVRLISEKSITYFKKHYGSLGYDVRTVDK